MFAAALHQGAHNRLRDIALADQYAGRDLGFVNPGLYRISRSARCDQAFHDVTTRHQHRRATPGWDPVTGWGSPHAQVLVPLLARDLTPIRGTPLSTAPETAARCRFAWVSDSPVACARLVSGFRGWVAGCRCSRCRGSSAIRRRLLAGRW